MIGRSLIALSFVAMAATAALAAGPDRGHVPNATMNVANVQADLNKVPPPGMTTIFSNFATKYKKGTYWCCNGFGIQGPSNGLGAHMLWDAMQFTPTANHTVQAIKIALQFNGGTNKIVVGLYSDNGGVPGTALKLWHLANLPAFPSCCTELMLKGASVPVSVRTPYWIVVQTDGTDPDSLVTWNFNSSDQIDPIPFAQYCSNDAQGSDCGGNNDTWVRYDPGLAPALAFSVMGQ
jgi:hypothetical protein